MTEALHAGIVAAVCLVAGVSVPASASVTVTDDAGRQIVLPHTPQRIISIAPGATEMLFAAGAGSKVVATVEFSEEPAAARRVPRIGDANAIDVERVVALRPDVVVVWEGGNNAAQVAQLERLGIPLYRHQVETFADLPASLRKFGALAGTREEAEKAAADMESRLAQLAHRYRNSTPLRVLLEVWNHPLYTVGGTHMMSDSLRVCGARNVFGDMKDLGPPVSIEAVIARNPDVIVAVAPTGAAREWLSEWNRYKSLRAVRNGALVPFEDKRLSRLGPSAVGGTAALCTAIDAQRRGRGLPAAR